MAPPVFPTLAGITFPVKRSSRWSTLHQEAVSGQDNPVPLWSFPRWAYEVPFSFLRSDNANLEWQALAAFYNQVQGSALVFQFTDPDDGAVVDQGFGSGDGTTVAFPLVRTMTGAGSISFTEPVFAPTAITNIKINGTPTAGYTLGTQGLVTFNTAPALSASLTWSGSFNWLCRFDEDTADFEKFMYQIWSLSKIKFTTIKTQSK